MVSFGVKTDVLSHLELKGVSFENFRPVDGLSLRRLTSLSLAEVVATLPSTQFITLLKEAPELEQLSLLGDVVQMGGNAPCRIHIPSLKSLTLLPGSLFNFKHLCNALTTPAVEELSLHHLLTESMEAFVESLHFSDPKYPVLRSLELRDPIAFPDATKSFLTEFPSIRQLTLVAYRNDAHLPVLDALAAVSDAPEESPDASTCTCEELASMAARGDFDQLDFDRAVHFCPPPKNKLSILLLRDLETLGVTPLGEAVFKSLKKVIGDRMEAGSPIKTLRSSTYDGLPSGAGSWLRERVSLGSI
ncbi:hypothetical protein HWV62_3965 [Athelia sp. TMB]|nr:hypothetical protein HWV62_3965 [Athelia sp. TMB]